MFECVPISRVINHQLIMKANLCLILVVSYNASGAQVPREAKLAIVLEYAKSGSLSVGLNIYSSANGELTTVPQKVDFRVPETLIGDREKIGWGFACSVDSGCTITNNQPQISWYNYMVYSYVKAEGLLQLFDNPSEIVFKGPALKFRYVEDIDDMYRTNWGVVGMSPDSEFFKYVRGNVGDFNIAIDHRLTDRSNDRWTMNMYLNHPANGVKVETELLSPNKWQFRGYSDLIAKERPLICLDPLGDYLLNFNKSAEFCLENIRKICRNQDNCQVTSMDFSLASAIAYEINGAEFVFEPRDYLLVKDNSIRCRLSNSQLRNGCDLTIGRYTLEKYPPVLIIGSKPRLRFLAYFSYQQDMLMVRTIIATTVASLLFLYLMLELCISRLKDEESSKGYQLGCKSDESSITI